MNILSRRKFLRFGFVSSVAASMISAGNNVAGSLLPFTPAEVEGPFYPITPQEDKDEDLTRIKGHHIAADGKPIYVTGQVMNHQGQPLANAKVEIWQANARGRYRHSRDPNPALIDKHFQGWAIITTNEQGLFRFRTIKPGAYPASAQWIRPPHIHFKVSKERYQELITQMYFPDEPLNEVDLLLQHKKPFERSLMIAKKGALFDSMDVFEFPIVLRTTI